MVNKGGGQRTDESVIMKIAVLSGGISPERDVSLSSGCMIANALAEKGHEVVFVDSFLGLEKPEEGLESLFKKLPEYQPRTLDVPSEPPDLEKVRRERKPDTGCNFGQNVLDICRLADVVFIALHGEGGEDGQVQATFDQLNIRYTGSGFYGCVKAMNKDVAKHLMKASRIPTARWEHVIYPEDVHWERIFALGYPQFIKPTCGGSSIATYKCRNEEEVRAALEEASGTSEDLICEEFFGGREFDVGILDGKALEPIEIIPVAEFFDYESKYQPGMSQEICPADISAEQAEILKDAALRIHKCLGLGFYSRIDFKMNADGSFTCLEANTLPGMTPGSLFPKEAKNAGISYPDLCDMIVRAAIR